MYKIPTSVRVLTILGLIFQVLGFVISSIFVLITYLLPDIFVMIIEETMMGLGEYNQFTMMFPVIRVVLIILLVVQVVFLLVNAFLLIPAIQVKKSTEQASSIFLYQAIYGGVTLFTNQFAGVMHLISGIIGRNQTEQALEPPREGI